MAILILLFAGIEAIQWQHDVVLDWDPIPGAESYGLIRSRDVDGHWQDATTIRTEGPEYQDPDLPPGRYRWEAISAWNPGGQQWDWNAAAVLYVQPVPIKLRWEIMMATKNFSEPADITGWLDTGEFLASHQVEVDGSGDLAVTGANTSGWRASNGWDPELGDTVDSSEVSWSATGDAGGEVAVVDADPTSLDFDGIDDNVVVPYDQSLFSQTITVSFWAWSRGQVASTVYPIAMYNTLVDGRVWGVVYDGGGNEWRVFIGSETGQSVSTANSGVSSPLEEWQHVVIRYDNNTDDVDFFLDGTKIAASLANSMTYADQQVDMTLGTTKSLQGTRGWNGLLADMRYYTGLLSDAQIQDLHELKEVDDTDLAAHWRLLDGSGTTATDSANNHDGTITGASWADGESPLYRPATSGQPIPGISQGDDLTGLKIYGRQVLNESAATMQSFSLQVTEAVSAAVELESVGELETDSYSSINSAMTADSVAEFETDSYSNISSVMTAGSAAEFETDNLATMDAISQLELISTTELSVDSLSVITASALLHSISEFQTDSRLLDAPPPLPQFFIQRHVREADIRHVTRRIVRLDECEKQ